MQGHHLILGQTTDVITGETLDDTLDERHRQQIGRLLVERKGYAKTRITPRHELEISVGSKCARLLITYLVRIKGRIGMLIQYGPGSLVTRHRPAMAMARLVAEYQVPVVVVTNGEQADILNGADGRPMGTGIDQIPDRDQLAAMCQNDAWEPVGEQRRSMEARILMAYEVDDRCPCDDSTCTIDSKDA